MVLDDGRRDDSGATGRAQRPCSGDRRGHGRVPLCGTLLEGDGGSHFQAPVKVNNGAFHLVGVTHDGVNETVYLDGASFGSAPLTQVGYYSDYQYSIGTGFTLGWPA